MSGQETSSCPRRLAALAARRSAGATLFFDNSNRSRKRFTPNPGIHSATNATRCNMKSKKKRCRAQGLGTRWPHPDYPLFHRPPQPSLIGVNRRSSAAISSFVRFELAGAGGPDAQRTSPTRWPTFNAQVTYYQHDRLCLGELPPLRAMHKTAQLCITMHNPTRSNAPSPTAHSQPTAAPHR